MISKILRADGVTELANIKSVTFHDAVNADVDLRPGCVSSAYIELVCYGSQSDAPAYGEELSYYQVIGSTETLIGKFYAEPSIPTKVTYSFVAYDAVNKLEADFSAWLSDNQDNFPFTVYQLVSQACTIAGVTLGASSWPMSTMSVNAFYADGITCRNVLQYAAEIAGKFVRANVNGNIVFGWYANASDKRIYPSSETEGTETRYAYKQDGLTYENYATSAVARVAVHPVGEDGAAYYYPTNALSGNTLNITNNAFLYGATSETMTSIAQNLFNVMTSLGVYRPMTVSMFPNECPFNAGDIVNVTDAQGVSFLSIVMEKVVSGEAVILSSTGREVYGDYAADTAKQLIQLAADIVRINKLKVDWAEINQIFAEDITVTGELHSRDYRYSAGSVYADAGIGIDFGAKRFNTPNFGIDPDGNVYAIGGQIAGFNLSKTITASYYPSTSYIHFYDVEGDVSSNYELVAPYNSVLAHEDGTATFTPAFKSVVVSGSTVLLNKFWVQCLSGGNEKEERTTPQASIYYYDSSDTLIHTQYWGTLRYYEAGSALGNTYVLNTQYLNEASYVILSVNIAEGDTCTVYYQYGISSALYTASSKLGDSDSGMYLGTDGFSAGKKIILTPDGHGAFGDLSTENLYVQNAAKALKALGGVSKSGDTMTGNLKLSGTSSSSLRLGFYDKNVTLGTHPTNDYYDSGVRFYDSNTELMGAIQSIYTTDGKVGIQIHARQIVNGNIVQNAIRLFVAEDGTRSVFVHSANAWRAALNLSTTGDTQIIYHSLAEVSSSLNLATSTYINVVQAMADNSMLVAQFSSSTAVHAEIVSQTGISTTQTILVFIVKRNNVSTMGLGFIYNTNYFLVNLMQGGTVPSWRKINTRDSGWIEVASFNSGFALYDSSSNVYYRRIGNIVSLHGALRNTGELDTSTMSTMFTLPSGYRPPRTIRQICQGSGTMRWLLQVNSTGAVQIAQYGSGSGSGDTIAAGRWLPFDITYMVD